MPHDALVSRCLLRTVALIVAIAISAACSSRANMRSSADTGSISTVIGPEGGTVSNGSGTAIVIPSGALATATTITLTPISAPPSVAAATAIGAAFSAGPEGQTFLKPVEIRLPFDSSRVPAGTAPHAITLAMSPTAKNDFAPIVSTVDIAGSTVSALTAHFTDFVPLLLTPQDPLFITTSSALPDATVGAPYAAAFAAIGGTPPYDWSLSAGAVLPPGLTLSSDGVLSGTPSAPANAAFFVTVHDALGAQIQGAFSLVIEPGVNPIPTLTALAPAQSTAGAGDTVISLVGNNFVPSSQVVAAGSVVPTTFVDGAHLSATLHAAMLASPTTISVAVTTPAPGGGTSSSKSFVVTNPLPQIASVTPTQIPLTNVDTEITVVGTSFQASSSVAIGAQAIVTTYVSSSKLIASIPASYLGSDRTLAIDVYTPPPGGGFSRTLTVIVGSGASDAGTNAGDAASDAGALVKCDLVSPCTTTCFTDRGIPICNKIGPGFCLYQMEMCTGGTYGTSTGFHIPDNVGLVGSVTAPDCAALTCDATTVGQKCLAPATPDTGGSGPGQCLNGGSWAFMQSSGEAYLQCEQQGTTFPATYGWTFLGQTYEPCTP
jgi:hypothetical protein